MSRVRPEFEIRAKQFDRLPVWSGTLRSASPNETLNLEGATIRFRARMINGDRIIGGVCTNPHPHHGDWSYAPTEHDTAVAGVYRYDVRVTFPDGRHSTWPNDTDGTLIIEDALAS